MNAFQMRELFILGFTCYFISKNFCMYKGLEAYILLEIKLIHSKLIHVVFSLMKETDELLVLPYLKVG